MTEPILKTSFRSRSCLSPAFSAYVSGHVRFPSPRSLSRLSSRAPHLLQDFPHPRERSHNRTIPRTFVERQEKRNEARAKRVANRGRKIKRQNGEIKREGTEFGPWQAGGRRRRRDAKTEDVLRVAMRLYRWPRRQMMIATNISRVVHVRSILRNNPGARRTLDFIFRRSDR